MGLTLRRTTIKITRLNGILIQVSLQANPALIPDFLTPSWNLCARHSGTR